MKKFASVFVVICLSMFANFAFSADPVFMSEHDRQDMALKLAMIDCREKGGTLEGFNWKQETRWKLYKTDTGYKVEGSWLSITCKTDSVTEPVSKLYDWKLDWSEATTRMDGSPLPPEQIAGYQILDENNKQIGFTRSNTYLAEDLPVGTKVYFKTFDKDGLESPPVSLELAGN